MFTILPDGADPVASGVAVVVAPVNCVGVLDEFGASLVRRLGPAYGDDYRSSCRRGELRPGEIVAWANPSATGPRFVVNLAVRDGKDGPARKEWVEEAAASLRTWLEKSGIDALAIRSTTVDSESEWFPEVLRRAFDGSDVDVRLCPPRVRTESAVKGRVEARPIPLLPDLSAPPSAYPGFAEEVVAGRRVYKMPGLTIIPSLFSPADADVLMAEIEAASADMPFVRPTMPRTGNPYRYDMAGFGPKIWVSDKSGYRYEDNRLADGSTGYLPNAVNDAASLCLRAAGLRFKPGEMPQHQTAVINDYRNDGSASTGTMLGMHRDQDEPNKIAPIESISLGSSCTFVFKSPTTGVVHRVRLNHGDGVVMHGPGRLALHGVDDVEPGRRINVTVRQVLNERIDVPLRGPRLPSVLKIIAEREAHPPQPSPPPIVVEIDNAQDYRRKAKPLPDPGTCINASRSAWVSKDLGVPGLWGLRNQFVVRPGEPPDASIANFNDSLAASLLSDSAVLARLGIRDAPDIARDFYRAVDFAVDNGRVRFLCHCHSPDSPSPKDCHTGVIAVYVAAELERRGKVVAMTPYLDDLRARYPDARSVVEQAAARKIASEVRTR